MLPARPERKLARNDCNEFIRLPRPALLQQESGEGEEKTQPRRQQISEHVVGLRENQPHLCRGTNWLSSPWLPPSHVSGTWCLAQMARRGTQRACQLSGVRTQVLTLALAARWKPDLQESASKKRKGTLSAFPFLRFKIKRCACVE